MKRPPPRRARRRDDLARMKRRARRLYPWHGQRAGKYANHLTLCSCPMCGNPRRFGGKADERLTRQECAATLALAEQRHETP